MSDLLDGISGNPVGPVLYESQTPEMDPGGSTDSGSSDEGGSGPAAILDLGNPAPQTPGLYTQDGVLAAAPSDEGGDAVTGDPPPTEDPGGNGETAGTVDTGGTGEAIGSQNSGDTGEAVGTQDAGGAGDTTGPADNGGTVDPVDTQDAGGITDTTGAGDAAAAETGETTGASEIVATDDTAGTQDAGGTGDVEGTGDAVDAAGTDETGETGAGTVSGDVGQTTDSTDPNDANGTVETGGSGGGGSGAAGSGSSTSVGGSGGTTVAQTSGRKHARTARPTVAQSETEDASSPTENVKKTAAGLASSTVAPPTGDGTGVTGTDASQTATRQVSLRLPSGSADDKTTSNALRTGFALASYQTAAAFKNAIPAKEGANSGLAWTPDRQPIGNATRNPWVSVQKTNHAAAGTPGSNSNRSTASVLNPAQPQTSPSGIFARNSLAPDLSQPVAESKKNPVLATGANPMGTAGTGASANGQASGSMKTALQAYVKPQKDPNSPKVWL